MNIIIRKAKPEDWQSVQKLNNEVFQNDKDNDSDMDLNWPYTEKGIKYYQDLANGTYGCCLVAEIDKSLIGHIVLSERTFSYTKSKYVEVENIGVSSEYRSRGIGKMLIDAAIEWAKQQGIGRLYLEACWGNTEAVKFYKNNGFVEVGVQFEKIL